jgi:hypothetical protein
MVDDKQKTEGRMNAALKTDRQHNWATKLVIGSLASSRLYVVFWCAVLTFSLVSLNNEYKLLSSLVAVSDGRLVQLRIPSDLDPESTRRLSLNLGGGACQWQVSTYYAQDMLFIFLSPMPFRP